MFVYFISIFDDLWFLEFLGKPIPITPQYRKPTGLNPLLPNKNIEISWQPTRVNLTSAKKTGNHFMKKVVCAITLTTLLTACGTAQGVFNGAGEVLNGMGKDARSLGSLFN